LESEPKVDDERPQRKMLADHRSQSRLILPKRVVAHPQGDPADLRFPSSNKLKTIGWLSRLYDEAADSEQF
jgi:hypothetical protein